MKSTVSNTPVEQIDTIVKMQRNYFKSGATLPISKRRIALQKLQKALLIWEKPLAEALWADLHKSYQEAYLTEISIVLGEIRNHLKHLGKWSRPERRRTPLKMFPSRSRIVSEPLGVSLIISPWNYPVQLLLNPLVGALSAGCTAILKPSPYVPNVSSVLQAMIEATFDKEYVAVVQGNREVNTALLEKRYDIIFFTGSPVLGRTVMSAAARNLTPVVLELGGKSPCIIDHNADIKTAAKRVAWGKSLNAGQTCIAPDYLLVHSDIKDKFIEELHKSFRALLGKDPQKAEHFVRIVNNKAFERLTGYLTDDNIIFGGNYSTQERYIEPTVVAAAPDSPIMQEEIFGPIFPLLTFGNIDEAINFVCEREKPLALYYFGDKATGNHVIERTSAGGSCINDTIMHIANENVPFGGVGNSGMGGYHGKLSFEAFSHRRTVVTTPTWIDLPFRYMPYKWFKVVKKLL
ncbi:MAG: aldehyde dehydrogenase [Rikenellaceae bacterium]|nr:aldehyde dehydrogenase [Rikenellaceae bacterium]